MQRPNVGPQQSCCLVVQHFLGTRAAHCLCHCQKSLNSMNESIAAAGLDEESEGGASVCQECKTPQTFPSFLCQTQPKWLKVQTVWRIQGGDSCVQRPSFSLVYCSTQHLNVTAAHQLLQVWTPAGGGEMLWKVGNLWVICILCFLNSLSSCVRRKSISNSYQEPWSTINQSDTAIFGYFVKQQCSQESAPRWMAPRWISPGSWVVCCIWAPNSVQFLQILTIFVASGGDSYVLQKVFQNSAASATPWLLAVVNRCSLGEQVIGNDSKVVSSSESPWNWCVELPLEWVKFLHSTCTHELNHMYCISLTSMVALLASFALITSCSMSETPGTCCFSQGEPWPNNFHIPHKTSVLLSH